MSQQNACGGPTCGCSSMCLHPEPTSGSSVPEAARAARTVRWGERFRLAQTKYSAGASRPDVAAALMALADAEVAAAVAEERATTGRRIEAALIDWFGGEEKSYVVSFDQIHSVVRAALASPGEGE